MPASWRRETCPACSAANWLNQGDPSDGDSSKLDTAGYDCHACGADVRLFADDLGTEYRPHVAGAEPSDRLAMGEQVQGYPAPESP